MSTRSYERSALVVAIAKVRADNRCELPNCAYPAFVDMDGIPFTEVHHIEPLSDGGEDVLENVACLCPAHHREVHVGRRATELTAVLRAVRDGRDNPSDRRMGTDADDIIDIRPAPTCHLASTIELS
jgi:predicted HNH restriction endonuclease